MQFLLVPTTYCAANVLDHQFTQVIGNATLVLTNAYRKRQKGVAQYVSQKRTLQQNRAPIPSRFSFIYLHEYISPSLPAFIQAGGKQ